MTASSVEAPSNSAKIVSYGAAEVVGEHVEPAAVGHADARPRARRAAADELDHLVEHRDRHVEALDRELLLAQVGLVHEALERVDLGQAAQQRLLLVGGRAACGTRRSRSSRAARRAGGARRCARSRRRSCRSRSRAGAGARRRASRPGTHDAQDLGRDPAPSARASGRSGSGSSAGSPSGSEPSGSSRAARWPCVRCALISDVAAWTACSSCSSVGAGGAGAGRRGVARRGRRGGGRRRRRAAAPSSAPRSAKTPLVEAVLALQVGLDDLQEAAGLGALDDRDGRRSTSSS